MPCLVETEARFSNTEEMFGALFLKRTQRQSIEVFFSPNPFSLSLTGFVVEEVPKKILKYEVPLKIHSKSDAFKNIIMEIP